MPHYAYFRNHCTSGRCAYFRLSHVRTAFASLRRESACIFSHTTPVWLSLCAGLSGLRGRVLVGVLGRGSFFILFQSPNSHITSRSQGGHSVSDTSTRFSPTALPPSSTIESSCVHRCGRVLIARCRTWYRPLRAASPVCPSDPSRRSPWSSAPPAPRPAAPPPRPCCHLGCHGARYVRA